MGSTLHLESKLNQGSRFSFHLALPFQNFPEQTTLNYKKHPLQSLKNIRVLLMEDDLLNCTLVEKLLGKMGFTCLTANSGQEALQHFQQQGKINIVLMDISMPDMDGFLSKPISPKKLQDEILRQVTVEGDHRTV